MHTHVLVSITFCIVVTPTIALNFLSNATENTESGNLAFIHIPYNFGHTVEKISFVSQSWSIEMFGLYIMTLGGLGGNSRQASWSEVNTLLKTGGEVWGHVNPDLQVKSDVTNCALYFTPPKYWPKDIAEKYMGGKTTFGILRDPTERLVAMFRGNIPAYGGGLDKYYDTCDVDGAVRSMLQRKESEKYGAGCTGIEQAEYFDGPYGIKLAVDNRKFPQSMNVFLKDNGYNSPDWKIEEDDVMHVSGCNNIGTWNITAATKALVQKAYPRDYELLCKLFKYCDKSENNCIHGVPEMCPDYAKDSYVPDFW